MRTSLAILTILTVGWFSTAQAESVADFYRGKSIKLMIAYPAGGGYDTNARTVGLHIGKHIPGNPLVVAQNYPGAAGLRLANHLYNVAPSDGSAIGILARGSSTAPLLAPSGTRFDARKFMWLGSVSDSPSLCVSWHTSKVKTFEDLMKTKTPFVAGAQGKVSDASMFTTMLANVFDANIKLVRGYPGTHELSIALERGEVEGRCGWAWGSIKTGHSDWLAQKKINLLVQLSLQKSPELPDVPLITDFARNDRDMKILRLLFSRQQMAYPFAAPPGVPSDRVAALRDAFDATMKDPAFLADAKKRQIDINPMSGAEMQDLIRNVYDTPEDVIAATKAAVVEKN